MSTFPCDCPVATGGQIGHSHACALFRCACGQVAMGAPDGDAPTYCPNCCPDHEYEYERGEGHRCKTCSAEPPHDWFGGRGEL